MAWQQSGPYCQGDIVHCVEQALPSDAGLEEKWESLHFKSRSYDALKVQCQQTQLQLEGIKQFWKCVTLLSVLALSRLHIQHILHHCLKLDAKISILWWREGLDPSLSPPPPPLKASVCVEHENTNVHLTVWFKPFPLKIANWMNRRINTRPFHAHGLLEQLWLQSHTPSMCSLNPREGPREMDNFVFHTSRGSAFYLSPTLCLGWNPEMIANVGGMAESQTNTVHRAGDAAS